MAELVFLGTNGWFDTQTGNTISTLIKTRDFNIVLDAGNGIAKLADYLDDGKPAFLFISHFHIDHIEGLHTLGLNRFSKGLTIVVQEGGTGILGTFMGMPFTAPLGDMGFQSSVVEVPRESRGLPFEAEFLPLKHSPFTQGIRFRADGVTIAHCLDTGYCDNAVKLARGSDLLILECTLRAGHFAQHHLCPELCAQIALESKTGLLALTHFEGKSYPDIKLREESERIVKKSFGNTVLGLDGLRVSL